MRFIRLILIGVILLYITNSAKAQEKYSASDSLVFTKGIITDDGVFYMSGDTISGSSIRMLIDAPELQEIYIDSCVIKNADFGYKKCSKRLRFHEVKFPDKANFSNAVFKELIYFKESIFSDEVDFTSATFENNIRFENVEFSDVNFSGIIFLESQHEKSKISPASILKADFSGSKFLGNAYFMDIIFPSSVGFTDCIFENSVDLQMSEFKEGILLRQSVFKERPNLFNASISGKLNISNTIFAKGVDFRFLQTVKLDIVYLESIQFPKGQLFLHWDNIKWDSSYKTCLSDEVPIPKKKYQRIASIYKQLRENYIAQGEKNIAESVMYELGRRKEEILKQPIQIVYRIFFGYGYKAWQFLLWVIFLIILFAIILFCFFYPDIAKIVDRKNGKQFSIIKVKKHCGLFPVYKTWYHFNERPIFWLVKICHVIYFSTSVLLGIRFKKEWIDLENKCFLSLITIEWIIGIGLYISFALLVNKSQFQFIKGLFGF